MRRDSECDFHSKLVKQIGKLAVSVKGVTEVSSRDPYQLCSVPRPLSAPPPQHSVDCPPCPALPRHRRHRCLGPPPPCRLCGEGSQLHIVAEGQDTSGQPKGRLFQQLPIQCRRYSYKKAATKTYNQGLRLCMTHHVAVFSLWGSLPLGASPRHSPPADIMWSM